MKYKKADTGDGVHNYLVDLMEFHKLSGHLLNAKTEQEFEVWFEKCEEIDKRSLLLFLQKHKKEIPENYLNLVKDRFLLL